MQVQKMPRLDMLEHEDGGKLLHGGYVQVEHADVLLSWNTRLPSMDKALRGIMAKDFVGKTFWFGGYTCRVFAVGHLIYDIGSIVELRVTCHAKMNSQGKASAYLQ
jgi:hypothetical protein